MTKQEKLTPLQVLDTTIGFVGGQVELAGKLDRTQSAISQWRVKGVPLDMVQLLVDLSGGMFELFDFRPDKFRKIKKA